METVSKEMPKAETVFRYKHVKSALAQVLQVTPEKKGVFDGKLRHLRNAGLPKERPGTGEFIPYTFQLTLEMLLALVMGQIWIAPKEAVWLAGQIAGQFLVDRQRYAMIAPPDEETFPGGLCTFSREEDAPLPRLPARTILDVEGLAQVLWEALRAAAKTE